MASYDVVGNIAIIKFKDEKKKEKVKLAKKILNGGVTTVLEKKEKVKGRLRTIKTGWLAGRKTKEAFYTESGCKFKFNVESCYFSPRLSGERLEIASKIKQKDNVLVLFAGVAPFSIIIARKTGAKATSIELGRECSKYALENVKLNKLNDRVKIIQGDVKKLGKLVSGKFDKIVMPRPQLKDSFLEYIWKFCKKGTQVYYYDFGKDISEIVKRVESEAKRDGKKIRITSLKKAGDIAPYKFRFRIDFIVLG